jgi:Zn finger protein HypA/HybF involved in hydrogenase expression
MAAKASERKIVYAQRKEKGNCPRCGNKTGKKSKYIYCDDCRAFFRNYNKERAGDLNKTRKALYDERKEKKLCPRCGKHLGKKYKKTICPVCLEKQYEYNYGKKRAVKGKSTT